VTRKQRREYGDWREATELTDEERAVGLPVIPGIDPGAAPPRRPRRERPEVYGELPTFSERLAHVRDPAEALLVLGRRRLAWYAFCSLVVGVVALGFGVYVSVEVVRGRRYAWELAMLPASVALSTLFLWFAYGFARTALTGRVNMTGSSPRIFEILNNTYVFPRRRRRSRRRRRLS
jgi:hypothetical protein